MRTQHDYDTRFDVIDDHLVRTSTDMRTGRILRNRCTRPTFEAVARAIDEVPPESPQAKGTCIRLIAQGKNLRHTQVAVALDFLKERGIVEVRRRMCYPATTDTYLNAMVEFLVLAKDRSSGTGSEE